MNFDNKIAVITGAGSGIGQATAIAFAKQKCKVILLDINQEGLNETEDALKPLTKDFTSYQVDLSNQDAVNQVFKSIFDKDGVPDILVNSAGLFVPQSYFDTTGEMLDKMFAVNVKGTFFTCRAVTDQWIAEKRKGKIINFSSITGRIVMRFNLPYAVAKSAVIHMSQIIALELGSYGINVNVICPGLVNTPMAKPFFAKPDLLESDLQRISMGCIQTVDECANAVLFLASDLANQITGEIISVDGGWHIGHP